MTSYFAIFESLKLSANMFQIIEKDSLYDLIPAVETGTHTISFEPISKSPVSNSVNEFSMARMSIDLIGAFWRTVKRELYGKTSA